MNPKDELQVSRETSFEDVNGSFSIFVEVVMVAVNVLPLVVVIKWKRYRERTTSDDLITAVSAIYIMSAIIPTPIGHLSYFRRRWVGGVTTCNFYQITSNWLWLSSLFLVTILAIDKSFGVYLYRKHKFTARFHGKCKVIASIVSMVLLSLFISCLPVMGFGPVTSQNRCLCWINETPMTRREYLFSVLILVCGFGNFICVSISSVYMFWSIRILKKALYSGNRIRSNTNSDVRWQIEGAVVLHGVRMVMAVSILQYITWFPTLILMTLKRLSVEVSDISIVYALLSTRLSGLLNPILYGLFDKSYRHGYKRIFQGLRTCCRCKTNQQLSIHSVANDNQSIPKSSSDAVQLANNSGPQTLSKSTSRHSDVTGFQNAAFVDNCDNSQGVPDRGAGSSALVKYIHKSRKEDDDERTGLLENSSFFVSSSAFGGPVDPGNESDASSSSSLISSHYDSQEDDLLDSSDEDDDGEEDDDEEEVDESEQTLVETAM